MVRTLVPSNDVLQASAVRFLIDGNEQTAANVLLSCELKLDGARGDTLRRPSYATIANWLPLEGAQAGGGRGVGGEDEPTGRRQVRPTL